MIKQVSIFLENRAGRVAEITEMLAGMGLNLAAISIADTESYGILRIIVENPGWTCAYLENICGLKHNYRVYLHLNVNKRRLCVNNYPC